MRDFKFRAWDAEDKIMVSWEEMLADESNDWQGFWRDEYDFEIMQYTGLKDKSFDEVDIYEGDLFGRVRDNETEVFGEVYFDTDFAGFCVKYPNGGWTTLGEHLMEKQNHREIIGNIYENPELLK